MKYTKTTLMELSHKYRSILKKCAFLNAAILLSAAIALPAGATSLTSHLDIDETSEKFDTADVDGASNISGGAVVNHLGSLTVLGESSFKNNNTTGGGEYAGDGGAIFTDNAQVNLNGKVTFQNNSAARNGGAIATHNWTDSSKQNSLAIYGTAYFTNNDAVKDGGAIASGPAPSLLLRLPQVC